MKAFWIRLLLSWVVLTSAAAVTRAEEPSFTRKEDVIYGRKFGTALTMDVLTPKNANGTGIVLAVSGGWFSSHEAVGAGISLYKELLRRGYTVFAVVHGSQPKFTIPEVLDDMHRAVRYIRAHAKDYPIDPDRIGITGGSAGGHLSLMQGTAGKEGNPKANDPVERMSSRVQAVACFFPPTDFLNYGETGKDALGRGTLQNFKAPFDFQVLDPKTRSFVLITDEEKRREIGRKISPINHVTKDSAPTLIIHGDADKLVPIQQAEILIAKLKEAGVPAELVTKRGAVHGWPGMDKDVATMADWFDKHLRAKGTSGADAWSPYRFLVGEWTGEGAGKPGQGAGAFSFAFALQEKVLVRKNRSDYPATKDRPAMAHEDLMVIYRGDNNQGTRAIYFDNEGHVIQYAVTFSDDRRTLVFLSEATPSTPRFRLSYSKRNGETLGIKFEIAPPGKPDAFSTYLEGTARRKEKEPMRSGLPEEEK
jgi:acetyl esterase/lipase